MTRKRIFTDVEQAEKRRKYNKAYALKKKKEIKEYYRQYNAGVMGIAIGDRRYERRCPKCNTSIKRVVPQKQPNLVVETGVVVVDFN